MAWGTLADRFPTGLHAINLPAGTELVRIHPQARSPVFFGPPAGTAAQNRFDAPDGQYRVLYAAQELPGAFVETVLRKPGRVLRRAVVEQRAWSALQLQRPLVVAKLFDEGLQLHGVDAGQISVDDYAPSRALAGALYGAFPTLDGVAYRSRYNNGQICFALFDRVATTDLNVVQTQGFDKIPSTVDQIMRLHGAVFDTSPPA